MQALGGKRVAAAAAGSGVRGCCACPGVLAGGGAGGGGAADGGGASGQDSCLAARLRAAAGGCAAAAGGGAAGAAAGRGRTAEGAQPCLCACLLGSSTLPTASRPATLHACLVDPARPGRALTSFPLAVPCACAAPPLPAIACPQVCTREAAAAARQAVEARVRAKRAMDDEQVAALLSAEVRWWVAGRGMGGRVGGWLGWWSCVFACPRLLA